MKIALCCILKLENHYLEEWVNHYINLGVDKIIIYDNNDTAGDLEEHIEDLPVVKSYIDSGVIDVHKIPGKQCAQIESYNECYKLYKDEYDWLMFFDIDEFLMLENHSTISEYLSQDIFKEFDVIHLNWKIYDDNDLVKVTNDDYSLVTRFTRPADDKIHSRINKEIKSIVRGSLEKAEFTKNPHTVSNMVFKCCDAVGSPCDSTKQKSKAVIHKGAWINHYICKTIEEYCTNKLVRRGGHTPHYSNLRYTRSFFFLYNKYTKEKSDIFESRVREMRSLMATRIKVKGSARVASPPSFHEQCQPSRIIKIARPTSITRIDSNSTLKKVSVASPANFISARINRKTN